MYRVYRINRKLTWNSLNFQDWGSGLGLVHSGFSVQGSVLVG